MPPGQSSSLSNAVSKLQSPDSNVCAAALKWLSGRTGQDSAAAAAAREAAGNHLNRLVQWLGDSSKPELQYSAAAVLLDLSFSSSALCTAIAVAPGCLGTLVGLLASSSVDCKLQELAACTVRNVAEEVHVADTVAAVPSCFSSHVALLSSSSTALQEHSVWALRNLVINSPAGKAGIAAIPGCIPVLVQLQSHREPAVHRGATQTLSFLVEKQPCKPSSTHSSARQLAETRAAACH